MGAGLVDDEELIEFSVRSLLSEQRDARMLVHDLASRWPEASPLQLIYVLSNAASAVEHMLADPDIATVAQDLWRMTGLVGVDLYMMQLMGLPQHSAADLMAYWRVHDRYFLP